jgi:CheY-like chemotaxis protein
MPSQPNVYAIQQPLTHDPASHPPASNDPGSDMSAFDKLTTMHCRTILLVEDEPFVREATCGILQHSGFKVLVAADAQQAIGIFFEQRQEKDGCRSIDLVMTDMILPGRTGQQLGDDLRRHSPDLALLVTSGYFNPEYETEDHQSRTYFLAKPYSKRTLIEKIDKILNAPPMARAAGQAS